MSSCSLEGVLRVAHVGGVILEPGFVPMVRRRLAPRCIDFDEQCHHPDGCQLFYDPAADVRFCSRHQQTPRPRGAS